MDWIENKGDKPPIGEWVTIWRADLGYDEKARWDGKSWVTTYKIKDATVSHWMRLTPPAGVTIVRRKTTYKVFPQKTTRDTQNS